MPNNKKRDLALTPISKLGIVSLIFSLGVAFVGTIWAIYLESIFHNPSYVGFVLTIFTIISGLTYIFLIPLIEKQSKAKIFIISLWMYIISYVSFYIFPTIWAVIILGAVMSIAVSLRITSFGIIVRDKSSDKSVSKNIGAIYTFFNLSWLIGPLIAGFLAEKYGTNKVFLFAAAFVFLSMFLFKIFRIKDNRTEKKADKNLIKVVIDFLKNKDRLLIYILSGGITFWWTLIYIYVPIYIIESGLNDIVIGYFLSAVIIPLVLLEYYFGKLSARIGFKKIFFIGYLIPAIIAIICFFIGNLYLVLSLLVLASVGIAMLESTTEAYFFDLITKKQRDKYYGPYNTTIDLNGGISLLLSAIVLLILPFKFIFIFIGASMFIFAFLSLKIKNIIESRKKG